MKEIKEIDAEGNASDKEPDEETVEQIVPSKNRKSKSKKASESS